MTVIADGRPGPSYVLGLGETSIGRLPENDIVLEGDGVSRRHVRIGWDGAAFEVEDLGSKNGALVNGERLAGSRKLRDGDMLVIPGWTLRFEAEGETATQAVSLGSASTTHLAGRAVVLKPETREVVVRGTAIQLAPKEYLAITLLYGRAGTVVSKEDLANHVWPEYKGDVTDYNIHQVVSRLRRELEIDPSQPRVLITRPGFGYMLVV